MLLCDVFGVGFYLYCNCSGAMARAAMVITVAPLELIRTNLQADRQTTWRTILRNATRKYTTQNHLTSRIVHPVGSASHTTQTASSDIHRLRGLWTGVVPTLIRDVPFSAIYWFLFERLSHSLVTKYGLFTNRTDQSR